MYCESCSPGNYCPTGEAEVAVTSGSGDTYYYALGGTSFERLVKPGEAFMGVDQEPTPCPDGSYWDTTGNPTCVTCPVGYMCPNPSRKETEGGKIECTNGYVALVEGLSVCEMCPAGYECSDGSTISPCSGGYFSLGAYTACVECPKGYQCESTTEIPELCPSGYSSDAGMQYCSLCGESENCPDVDVVDQTACGPGEYAYTDEAGHPAVCLNCPAGYECPSGTIYPVPCPSGYVQVDSLSGTYTTLC